MSLTLRGIKLVFDRAACTVDYNSRTLFLIFNDNGVVMRQSTDEYLHETEPFFHEYTSPAPAAMKENSTALFCNPFIFYISTDNRLKHYVYDIEAGGYKVIDEWGGVKGGVHIHPQTKLSGGFTADGGHVVIFESAEGVLTGVRFRGGLGGEWAWEPVDAPGFARGGHHAFACDDDGTRHLLYVHQDGRMRHIASSPDGEKVKDEVVPSSTPDDGYEKVRFLPALDREEGSVLPFDIYFHTPAGKVLRIDTKGEKTDAEAAPDKMIDDWPAVMY